MAAAKKQGFLISVLNWVITSVIQSLQFKNDYKFDI